MAMNRVQATAIIRFALHELVARNGAHEFEELCRQLAIMRIASNFVRATGPVTKRGDQGADFETFRTYLGSLGLGPHTFVGRSSDQTLVGTCTLQQDDLGGKILEDIGKIVARGNPVDRIYAFCERNIPVGDRHLWQGRAKERYDKDLEILDGEWIAEALANKETLWIAEQFLHLPATVELDEDDEAAATWYTEVREEWRHRTGLAGTFAEHAALRRASRHAASVKDAQADIPFWIGWLERLLEVASPLVKHKALYDVAWVSLRNMQGTLKGLEPRLRTYLEEEIASSDPTDLEDRQVMLMYMAGADQRELIALEDGELARWRESLEARVARALESATDASIRAHLLQTVAYIRFVPIPPYGPPPSAMARRLLATLLDALVEAERGPLFPIDAFAQHVSLMTTLIVDEPGYVAFIEKLDALVAQRMGRAAAADRTRDRAIALHNAGRLVAALQEFHRVRIDWFAGDTIRGSLLAMAMVTDIYRDLHLPLASKYYGLALAHLAFGLSGSDVLDLAPHGVLAAAQADYEQGALLGYMPLVDRGLRLRYRIEGQMPGPIADGEGAVYGLLVLKGYARRHDPDLHDRVSKRLEGLNFANEAEQITQNVDTNKGYATPAAWADLCAEEFGAVAFSDAGPERVITWRALGMTWRVSFANTYATTRAAERFCALAQVLLADLADVDLALLPTEITIHVTTSAHTNAEARPSNDGRVWDVAVPATVEVGTIEPVVLETLAVVTLVLIEASLLPQAQTDALIEKAFERGITDKLVPHVNYDTLYDEFVSEQDFDAPTRRERRPVRANLPVVPLEHPDLAWRSGPGPTYDAAQARDMIRNRYRRSGEMVRLTLPRLLADSNARQVIADLREAGWPDWRILGAMAVTALNYRVQRSSTAGDLDAFKRTFLALAGRPESEADQVVPTEEFTRERLEFIDQGNMPSTVLQWDLELHQHTPDVPAIRRFLAERYRHSVDDIEHEDPFAAPAGVS
jgi:hypothetical protein